MKSKARRAVSSHSGRSKTTLEDYPRIGHRRNHQPIPVGEHLVIPPRPYPVLARLQQERPAGGQLPLGLVIGAFGHLRPVENVFLFPIPLRRHVVEAFEQAGALAEHAADFCLGPNIIFAFFMLAVGIKAAREPAFRGNHLAFNPT
jgi:hypothetical protein